MDNDNVVSGLLRRRQEIADELDVVQGRVRQLVIELDALDVTIHLFRPALEIGLVRVKPVPRRHAAVRGESTKMILGALRTAKEPMTTRELVRVIMEQRGMNTADPQMVSTMRLRIASSLNKLHHRKRVVSHGEPGAGRRWSVAL